ncbi:MAG TPA: HEAT repeat domain-containing protein [Candidatus Acidoferrales bacterium]|nr:HEAT repeat domain-containing protein [Candidatus Acidoferrales bacterium]
MRLAAAAIALGFVLSSFALAAEDPPLVDIPLGPLLRQSDLVCSATIRTTWRTGQTLPGNGVVLCEHLVMADADTVFKGKLANGGVTFRWYSPPQPAVPGLPSGRSAHSGPPVVGLAPGTRYLLFLQGSDSGTWRVDPSVYPPGVPFISLIAAQSTLGLDASALSNAARNHELGEEFVAAARSLEQLSYPQNALEYFDWTGELLGTEAPPLIRPFLTSGNPWIRYFAATQLALSDDASGQEVLLASLRDRGLHTFLRAGAAWGLARLHDTEALPVLEGIATNDPDSFVRGGALRALWTFDDRGSVPALVQALDDPVEYNRLFAARDLGKIILGRSCALATVEAHEAELVAAWKAWAAGIDLPPDTCKNFPP